MKDLQRELPLESVTSAPRVVTWEPLPPVDAAAKMRPVIRPDSTDIDIVASLGIVEGSKVLINGSTTQRTVTSVTLKGKLRVKGVRHVVSPRKVRVL